MTNFLDDGLYIIKYQKKDDMCLDIKSNQPNYGRLQIYGCGNSSNNQKFKLTFDSSIGGYKIEIDSRSGQCLDVFDREQNDGKRIQHTHAMINLIRDGKSILMETVGVK